MASLLRDAFPFFGIRAAGATERMIQQGRRRSATIFAFMAFVLMAAGQADEEWISGGFENQNWAALPPADRAASIPAKLRGICPGCTELGAAPLGDTFQRRFNLGLHRMTVEGSFYFNNSGVTSWRECQYPLIDFITDFNAAISGGTQQWALNLKQIAWAVFATTQGMLIFASINIAVAWLGLVAVMYEVPIVTGFKWTPLVLRLTSGAGSLFAIIGMIIFGTSPTKSEFCSVFDPDGDFLNLPCYFGNGFNNAAVAAAFSAGCSLMLWVYVSPDYSAGVYEFKGASSIGGGSVSDAPLASSGEGGASVSASFQGSSSGATGSAYQGFGSDGI